MGNSYYHYIDGGITQEGIDRIGNYIRSVALTSLVIFYGVVFLIFLAVYIAELVMTYRNMKKIRALCDNDVFSSVTGELCLYIFVPFYCLYWVYTRADKIHKTACQYGIPVSNHNVVFLILRLFVNNIGGVITACLMRSDINILEQNLNNITYFNAVDGSRAVKNEMYTGYGNAPKNCGNTPGGYGNTPSTAYCGVIPNGGNNSNDKGS